MTDPRVAIRAWLGSGVAAAVVVAVVRMLP